MQAGLAWLQRRGGPLGSRQQAPPTWLACPCTRPSLQVPPEYADEALAWLAGSKGQAAAAREG